MKKHLKIFSAFSLGLLALSFVTACTRNTVIIVAPQAQVDRRVIAMVAAGKPCLLTPEEKLKYTPTSPETTLNTPIPQIAKDKRVDGCAGIAYQLDALGRVSNAYVVKEMPIGYGFGDSTMKRLKGSTFKPPRDTTQWHYWMSVDVTSTLVAR